MSFRFLRSGDKSDMQEWRKLFDGLPQYRQDIHLHPEYVGALNGGLAVHENNGLFIVEPLVIRTYHIDDRNSANDLISPYYFGGPVSSFQGWSDRLMFEDFEADLIEWCGENNIISQYRVLNPMMVGHQSNLVRDAVFKKDTVRVMSAPYFRDAYRRDRSAGVAKAAAKSFIATRIPKTHGTIGKFIDLYKKSMKRLEADSFWNFSDEYLHDLCLMDNAHIFVVMTPDNAIEVISLVLVSGNTAHYHLTANTANNPKSHANDLLIDEIIRWASVNDLSWVFLGGGRTSDPNDSLLAYKKGFSPTTLQVKTQFRIFDVARYDEMVAAREAVLQRKVTPGFVPAYLSK